MAARFHIDSKTHTNTTTHMKFYHWLLIIVIPLIIIFIANYIQQRMCVDRCDVDDKQCLRDCKNNYSTHL